MQKRSHFLVGASSAIGSLALAGSAEAAYPKIMQPFQNGERPLAAFPQKRPLIVLTPRPPQLETPFAVFDEGILTPNDAFFVRWHNADIPTDIDAAKHRIAVTGTERTLSLSIAELKAFEPVELIAVNQCSGNSRGLFGPRVPGGQWANGAMGNARWKGARLRDILAKAGIKAGTKQIRFNGLDQPALPDGPDFMKSLDVEMARDENVIVAYEMNGFALPLLNGFPVRLVVPGWYSTYWVKMLSSIEALDHVDDNFWMKTAYRVPATPNNSVAPTDKGYPTVPISTMNVRSFLTNVKNGSVLASKPQEIRGIAFDKGTGIAKVEYSTDGGETWRMAALGRDFGRFSFRQFRAEITPKAGTAMMLATRATAGDGSIQVATPTWQPSGYMRNQIETYKVTIA